ncbi:class I adenylate-forming enzyme family protein [Actinophytocola algeriensis]|uniref:Long-chain acyl-CoA synthetase n=1 Tax=Actinophytocola algeriensis TaxID=1768010 RepID=A0A7W7Q9Y3_9PSEU|nr:AMP-binding protein [Actinophytocola algeriensis]MBB4909752.1 long-chain acyl-CoA synthetase [Actinophytocola algeriensis]MBE1475742.1 long-chain acyl-CoA synthetase [Actinophytocola algeriensis]
MPVRTDVSWPPGLPGSLVYPEVAAGAILAGAARRYGDRVAFSRGAEAVTYRQLGERAAQAAHGLLARGVRPGDRVALRMPNCLEYPVAYYGTLLAGAVFVPVNPLLPEPAAAKQIADAGAVLTLSPSDVPGLCTGQPAAPPVVDIDVYGDLAHLAYTGGTTGESKGVRLPHRNVVVNTLQYACWGSGSVPALDADGGVVLDQVASEDEYPSRLGTSVAINLTPWFHAMGTIAGLNALLLLGYTTVLHDRLDPGAYLADAERLRITSIGGAPALFAALLNHPAIATTDLTTVRTISSGAAPMPLEMINRMRALAPDAVVTEGYGLTEVTMGATLGPVHRSGVRKVGTVGVPTFDTRVRILDSAGAEVPAGERGEVCVKGPQVMAGYHNRPDATAEVIRDGWLHTGDVGVLDEDGYLSIVDRMKDMLLYKGYNVYPRELEEILAAQPGVLAAAVVGKPDPSVGELPVAFVVPASEAVTADSLMSVVNEQVVAYKRLRDVVFVDQIPVSAAGKVLKRELRSRLS